MAMLVNVGLAVLCILRQRMVSETE